jgi:hypothetical protein
LLDAAGERRKAEIPARRLAAADVRIGGTLLRLKNGGS